MHIFTYEHSPTRRVYCPASQEKLYCYALWLQQLRLPLRRAGAGTGAPLAETIHGAIAPLLHIIYIKLWLALSCHGMD